MAETNLKKNKNEYTINVIYDENYLNNLSLLVLLVH